MRPRWYAENAGVEAGYRTSVVWLVCFCVSWHVRFLVKQFLFFRHQFARSDIKQALSVRIYSNELARKARVACAGKAGFLVIMALLGHQVHEVPRGCGPLCSGYVDDNGDLVLA